MIEDFLAKYSHLIKINEDGTKSCDRGADLMFEAWSNSRDYIDSWEELDNGEYADSKFMELYHYIFSPMLTREKIIESLIEKEIPSLNFYASFESSYEPCCIAYPYIGEGSKEGFSIKNSITGEVVLTDTEYLEAAFGKPEYKHVQVDELTGHELYCLADEVLVHNNYLEPIMIRLGGDGHFSVSKILFEAYKHVTPEKIDTYRSYHEDVEHQTSAIRLAMKKFLELSTEEPYLRVDSRVFEKQPI